MFNEGQGYYTFSLPKNVTNETAGLVPMENNGAPLISEMPKKIVN